LAPCADQAHLAQDGLTRSILAIFNDLGEAQVFARLSHNDGFSQLLAQDGGAQAANIPRQQYRSIRQPHNPGF
jgi:hypothetical protein